MFVGALDCAVLAHPNSCLRRLAVPAPAQHVVAGVDVGGHDHAVFNGVGATDLTEQRRLQVRVPVRVTW